jgi:hypothetical protein
MERHPNAHSSELRFTTRHRITTAFVQIASDVLAVFVSLGFQTRLMLWNWEVNQLLSVCVVITKMFWAFSHVT